MRATSMTTKPCSARSRPVKFPRSNASTANFASLSSPSRSRLSATGPLPRTCFTTPLSASAIRRTTRHQLIAAYAALRQTQDAIDLYKQRLAAAPEDLAEYRCLAHAYLAAGEYEEAGRVVEAGLSVAPDVGLLEHKGSVLAGQGRPEEALATWQRVFELDSERISARYSRVFLLERLGRLTDAAAEWEAIIAWLRERGYDVQAQWPERELARLRAEIAAHDED